MGFLLPGRTDAEFAIVLDCLDLDRMASFWSSALGYLRGPSTEPYCSLLPPAGPDGPEDPSRGRENSAGIEILLQRVPEAKVGKNRLHFDIRVQDIDTEVDRLTGLGARVVSTSLVEENGWSWLVLADPEDNEFCVLRPAG